MTRDRLYRMHILLQSLRDLKDEAEHLGLEELDHLIGIASLSIQDELLGGGTKAAAGPETMQ